MTHEELISLWNERKLSLKDGDILTEVLTAKEYAGYEILGI